MLRLCTFGGLSVERDGVPVEVRRRGLAILAQLAAAGERGVPRAKLVLRLWPDSDEDKARGVLAQTLYKLRRELGDDDVVTGGGDLRLNPDLISSDVGDFEAAVTRGDDAAAAAAWAGPFLDGFYLPGAGEFERWVEEERGHYRERAARILESLAVRTGDIGCWRRLAGIDPLNSRIALGLMQALAAGGDPAGALRAGALHEQLLRSELGVHPDPGITALAETLRRRRPAEPAAAPATRVSPADALGPDLVPPLPAPVADDVRRPRRLAAFLIAAATVAVITISLTTGHAARAHRPLPVAPRADAWTIAVLPFENLSGSPERDYAADGLTEEITGALSRVAGLRVVARTSASAFAHRKADVREVARALGAQAVLEGSIRQDGNRVRISAQLVNALDGLQLWSADYDRRASDMLAVQDEIAKTIADSLRRRSPDVGELVVLRGTEDIEAHDLYLRGRHAWNERTREGIERAVALFQGAIARDAQYAEAYSGLADAYVQLGNIGGETGGLDRAAAAASHALQLAPGLSEAHVSRALVLAIRGDADDAEREYQRAIALDPGYATAHHWYALLLQSQDRGADALTELRQAVAADPLSPVVNNALGVFLYLNREFPAAIGQLQHTLALDSSFSPAAISLAQVEGCAGRVGDAIAVLRRPGAASTQSDYPATLASVYALAGYGDSARMLLGEMKRSRDRSPFLIGAVHAVLHESDSAFAWLRQTDWRQSGYLFLVSDPMLDPIRADRRYRDLLGELGIGDVTVPIAAARCEWGRIGAPAGG